MPANNPTNDPLEDVDFEELSSDVIDALGVLSARTPSVLEPLPEDLLANTLTDEDRAALAKIKPEDILKDRD